MSVDGFKKLDQQLKRLSETDMRRAVATAIQTVRSAAVNNCPVDTGALRQSIFTEVTEEDGKVIGTCWANAAYAPYVEFGTGPVGQDNHEGISPEYAGIAYSQSPWWLHESQIDQRPAEKYRWFYIDTPKGRFYQCSGQPAHPFMYPALKDNEEQLWKDMKADFYGGFKKTI